MNHFFLVVIAILLVMSGTFLFFYNRDVLSQKEGVVENCLPINLHVSDVSAMDFTVEWETSDNCLGLLKYGDSIDSMVYIAIDESANIERKEHSILVKNLKPSSVYYVVVFSEGVDYGVDGNPIVINTKAF